MIKRTGDPKEADIFQSGQLIARLENGQDRLHALLKVEDGSGEVYRLDPKVDGVISPFSSEIYNQNEKPVLKIRSGCFSHQNKIYLFKSLPEGKSMQHHLNGMKYICRLENFPYHNVDEIDRETWQKLGKHRGVDVGSMSGLGTLGHKVSLRIELADIGLPLSAASYLLYSTG
jgi:hypothetical protein